MFVDPFRNHRQDITRQRPKKDLQREGILLSCGRAVFRKQIAGRAGIAWGFHNIERVRNSRLGPSETEEGHDS